MPSELSEPTLDELSAYIDDELDAGLKARVAQHVAGCADCQARVDGLRQTANALRGLPMESPPRTFTIPAQRRQASRRWAPVGWLGGAAAAAVLIVVGYAQLHGPGSTATSAGTALHYANGSASQNKSAGTGAVAPLAAPAASTLDQGFAAPGSSASATASTVVDPTNGSRRLILDTDSASYSTDGKMRVFVQLLGSPSSSTNSGDQGLTLTLVHDGVGVALKPVGVISWNGTPIFGGWYDLRSLPLSGSRAGEYRLEATWAIPDGSGRVLQSSVAIRLTGS